LKGKLKIKENPLFLRHFSTLKFDKVWAIPQGQQTDQSYMGIKKIPFKKIPFKSIFFIPTRLKRYFSD